MSARKPLDTSRYDALNLESARRVLANPNVAQYEDAAMVKWARRFMARWEAERVAKIEAKKGKKR